MVHDACILHTTSSHTPHLPGPSPFTTSIVDANHRFIIPTYTRCLSCPRRWHWLPRSLTTNAIASCYVMLFSLEEEHHYYPNSLRAPSLRTSIHYPMAYIYHCLVHFHPPPSIVLIKYLVSVKCRASQNEHVYDEYGGGACFVFCITYWVDYVST